MLSQKLKSAGFSKSEIDEYLVGEKKKLKTAGFTDKEINIDFYGEQKESRALSALGRGFAGRGRAMRVGAEATAETAAVLGSGMVAFPTSGLAGIAGLPSGRAGEFQEKTAGALTFEPKTEGGRLLTGAATKPLEAITQAARFYGDEIYDFLTTADSPLVPNALKNPRNAAKLAATTSATVEAAVFLGIPGLKKKFSRIKTLTDQGKIVKAQTELTKLRREIQAKDKNILKQKEASYTKWWEDRLPFLEKQKFPKKPRTAKESGEFFREKIEAGEIEKPVFGEKLKEARLDEKVAADFAKFRRGRKLKDIVSDANKAIGERGSLTGKKTPEQIKAINNLKSDYAFFKVKAKEAGVSVDQYLKDAGIDTKVISEVTAIAGGKPVTKYAQSVNLERQDVTQTTKEFETAISKGKDKISWKEVEVEADKIASSKTKLKGTYSRLEKISKGKLSADITAAREYNAKTMAVFGKVVDDFKGGKMDRGTFYEKMNQFDDAVFQATSDASSEIGRALNMHKKIVSGERIMNLAKITAPKKNINQRQIKLLTETVEQYKKGELTPERLKEVERTFGDPKFSDYLLEYWYNSILSGIPTHLVNALGNTAWSSFQIPHRGLVAAVDIPYAKLTGKPRSRYMNEILPMFAGYKTGFKKGVSSAKEIAVKGEMTVFDDKWVREMNASAGAFKRSPYKTLRDIAPYIDPPTRGLRAMDVWAKSIAYDGQARSLARRASNKKGLKGKDRDVFEKKYVENLSEADHKSCMKEADYSTFMTEPDPLTKLIIESRNIPVVGPLLRFAVLPFVNTISNLAKRGVEMTPVLGVLKEGISRGMKKGILDAPKGSPLKKHQKWAKDRQHNTPEVIAKQIEGAVIGYYVIQKAASGEITGALPDNPSERAQWKRTKKLPYAIKFGDTWYQYRRIEPFNTVVAAATIAYDKIKNAPDEKTRTEIFSEFAHGVKWNVLDASYLTGMQSVFNRHDKNMSRGVERFGSSLVPYSSLLRSMARAQEVATEGSAKAREAEGFWGAFSMVIPGLSGKLPAKLDAWGEEQVIPGGVFRQWLPYKWSIEKTDAVETELKRLDIYPSLPDQKTNTYEFSDEAYRKFCISYGHKSKKNLNNLIKQDGYKKLTLEAQKKIINSLLSGIRSVERVRAKSKQGKSL